MSTIVIPFKRGDGDQKVRDAFGVAINALRALL